MMKRLALLFSLLFISAVQAEQIEKPTEPIFLSQKTELHQVSALMTAVEQKVRNASVRILNEEMAGHGTGSVIKYKGFTLILTAQHVVNREPGSVYFAVNNNEIKKAYLIYSDEVHDIAVLFLVEDFENLEPMKFAPRDDIAEVGEEITYSGFPASHQLMTFRGKVAGYEDLPESGKQIMLHTYGWFGCSGSVIYDSRGRIVGILWGVDIENYPAPRLVEDLIWVTPINNLNIDVALAPVCDAVEYKHRACNKKGTL